MEGEKEKYAISNLSLNGKKSDFGPVLFNDGLIFASARDTLKFNGKLYPRKKRPYLDFYITRPDEESCIPEKFGAGSIL